MINVIEIHDGYRSIYAAHWAVKPFPCFTNMFLYETNRVGKHVKHENDQRLVNAHSCPVPTARDVTFHSVLNKQDTNAHFALCVLHDLEHV